MGMDADKAMQAKGDGKLERSVCLRLCLRLRDESIAELESMGLGGNTFSKHVQNAVILACAFWSLGYTQNT